MIGEYWIIYTIVDGKKFDLVKSKSKNNRSWIKVNCLICYEFRGT